MDQLTNIEKKEEEEFARISRIITFIVKSKLIST